MNKSYSLILFPCLLRTQKFAAQEIIIPRASSSGEAVRG